MRSSEQVLFGGGLEEEEEKASILLQSPDKEPATQLSGYGSSASFTRRHFSAGNITLQTFSEARYYIARLASNANTMVSDLRRCYVQLQQQKRRLILRHCESYGPVLAKEPAGV